MAVKTSETFGMRLHHWDGQEGDDWVACRKYDGHSAIWIPALSTDCLWTIGRHSGPKPIFPPKSWLKNLPIDQALHGELWHPSDSTARIMTAKASSDVMKWRGIKFVVFGYPTNTADLDVNDSETYKSIANDTPWCYHSVKENDVVCTPGYSPMTEDFQEYAVGQSWEGLVVQNKNATYINGRTRQVLKWKPVYDNEAIVIGYEEGKTGARVGTVGALRVRMYYTEKLLTIHGCPQSIPIGDYTEFSVAGLNSDEWDWKDAERTYPIGMEIKFTFLAMTHLGTPQFCNISRSELDK